MTEISELDGALSGSTSDAFMIIVHDGGADWNEGAYIVSGGENAASSHVMVTSRDGSTNVEIPREQFLAAPHVGGSLVLSADWLRDHTYDGYAMGIFDQFGPLIVETYHYGTLSFYEAPFAELVYRRFEKLVDSGKTALLGIDNQGTSGPQEWIRMFEGIGAVPHTATLVATTHRGIDLRGSHLGRQIEDGPIKVHVLDAVP